MTHIAYKVDGMVVVDDVLCSSSFTELRNEIANGRFQSVHASSWNHAWSPTDVAALRGPSIYYDPNLRFSSNGPRYPTGACIDDLVDAVLDTARNHVGIVGTEEEDWDSLYLCPWIYPRGSALPLHRDNGRYTGAFTYFAHPHWGIHWGGELVVLGRETAAAGAVQTGFKDDALLDAIGICIAPRPNRLVLIASDFPHRIARIDDNAGENSRTSIAGFFLRA